MSKIKEIEDAIKAIEKKYGKGAIMKLGSNERNYVSFVSTGVLPIDVALGVGGYPKGRIVEIYGPESSGKTTMALHAVAEVQRNGGHAAFIDAEHSLDPSYARNIGVDIDNLLISQPGNGEEALEITNMLVNSGVDILIVDSVAALVPKAELEGEMGDSHIGLQARLMSQALRKLAGSINSSQSIVIFINQIREKVGVIFGSPETTPGGRALKFYSSVRLEIRKRENIKEGDNIVGTMTRAKVVKNKVAPPFKEAFFPLIYGKGVSKEGSVLDLAVEKDIIKKSGSWYSYKDEKLGQGVNNARLYLMENPEVFEEIEGKVRDAFFSPDF